MDEELHLYKNNDGTIHRATQGEPISREFIQGEVDRASAELRRWSNVLAEYDRLTEKPKPAAAGKNQPPEPQSQLEAVDDGDGHLTFKKKTAIPVI